MSKISYILEATKSLLDFMIEADPKYVPMAKERLRFRQAVKICANYFFSLPKKWQKEIAMVIKEEGHLSRRQALVLVMNTKV